jgi:hypothetical protein
MKDELGSNVPPLLKTRPRRRGHWVVYDLDVNGKPAKKIKGGKAYGQLTKRFDTQFEAVMWLAAYELRGHYLGEGYPDQLRHAWRTTKLIGDQE